MSETLKLTATEHVIVRRSEPDLLEVEGVYAPGGEAPPKHFHPGQDESFRVIVGGLKARVGGVERELRQGDTLEVPRGAVHQIWNPGSEETRVAWQTRPAGRTEEWFRGVDALQRAAGDGEPSPLAFGPLLKEFSDTFRLAVGPRALSGPLTTVLAALGSLRGHGVPASGDGEDARP